MFFVLSWIIYGLIVGVVAKAIHRGDDPLGFFQTIGIGVAGSYLGGLINWLVGFGVAPFEPSGILMGVIGGVLFCYLYRKYKLNQYLEAQKVKDHAD